MSVAQMFPKTVEEFMEEYKMVDKDHVYSNGIEYVPIFRMKQWFEHISSTHSKLEKNSQELDNKNGELISRQEAVDAISKKQDGVFDQDAEIDTAVLYVYSECKAIIKDLPSVHPELSNNSPELDKEIGECNDCIKHGGDWECDRVHCHKGDVPDTNVGELISRQAAIDLVESFYKIDKSVLKIMVFKLKQLPSVQPETNCSEIPNNSDLISRQAAIDLLKQMRKDGDMIPWEGKDVFARIRKLPSAQPEIIRCKDCKHWRQQTNYQGAPLLFGFCESDDMWRSLYGETYEVSRIDTDDDFHCGHAERRTDEK